MMALPQPDVILTHESDLDGLVAGVLLQRLAKKNLRAALDELGSKSPPSDEAIHEARTRL